MQTDVREGIWRDIAPELRERLGADRYDRWLAPLSVLGIEDGEVRLGAPNKFWLEWIEKGYLNEIAEALSRRLRRPVRVALAIDPALFCGLRQEQREILAGVSRSGPSEDPLPEPAPWTPAGLGSPSARPSPPIAGGAEGDTLASFVVGESNCIAHRAALQVVEAPGAGYNPLFVYGGCGLGKTHLLRGIFNGLRRRQPRLALRYLSGEDFLNQFLASLKANSVSRFRDQYRAAQVLLVDDVHLLSNKIRTQEEFLYTFNALVDAHHQVVMASDGHPRTIENLQKSLLGRFISGLVVQIGKPDGAMRLEIVRRRSERARAAFHNEVLAFLADKVRGNVRDLIGAFNLLEAHAFHEGRAVDPAEAERILSSVLSFQERRVQLRQLADRVARHYGVTLDALVSSRRHRSLSLARQVAMYLSRKYTGRSLAEVGKFFGGRNHSSVKCAEVKVESLRKARPTLAKDIETIIDSLEE